MGRERWRLRARRWLRRLGIAVTVAALAGGMTAAVQRGSEARRLSERISALEAEEARLRARVTETMRRVDSLTSRDRIERAAARLGLRPASDEEITFLREGSGGDQEEGGDR